MKPAIRPILLLIAALALSPGFPPAFAQQPGLRAGAARVDITPALADLPNWFKTIHDRIHARVVLLDDGATRAVIVVMDAPTIATDVSADLRRRIAAQVNAPLENVVVAVTHTHNAVRLDNTVVGVYLPGSPKIVAATVASVLDAVQQAAANLQPARAGYAEGETHMIGRRASSPRSEDDAVERRLGVFRVESLSGEPIALLINSGLSPLITQAVESEISADLAGVTERTIEQRYGDKAVVMYTLGSVASSLYNARPQAKIPAADPHTLMNAVGTLIAEDALAIGAQISARPDVKIRSAQRILRCPGKETSPLNNARSCSDAPGSKLPACVFKDRDTGPVDLQMGLLQIGELRIVTADANVTQPVWQKLRKVAPANTIMVSLVYGPMHYVMADAAYPSNSYQVTATTARRGCAEQGFIDTAQSMITESD